MFLLPFLVEFLHMIKLVNVHQSFQGIKALNGVTLSVEQGEFWGIMGPLGSGKSTLCRVICGLQKPDAGVVFLAGKDMIKSSKRDLEHIRSRIGVQFQNDALFEHMSVIDNIMYPVTRRGTLTRRETLARAMEYLAMVGLTGFEDRLPNRLSGGQRRRIALARACVTEPDILICDDPTAGLDPVTSRRILDMIAGIRYQAKNTVIIVSSDILGVLSVSNKVALMWDGQIIAHDDASSFWNDTRPKVKRFLDDARISFPERV